MPTNHAQRLEHSGIIPVLRAPSRRHAHALIAALVAGGIEVIEVTMTVPDALIVLEDAKREFGDRVLLGSGTVMDPVECAETIAAGAEFVVTPSLRPKVIEATKALGKLSIPGALTPTEVIAATEAGGDYVKVFPCSALGGAGYLRALLAPFPRLRLIPTGGVTLATAPEFLKAGARALGVGGDLVSPEAIDAGTPELITEQARAYVRCLAAAKQPRY